jgi:GR25 family glycosyltransferase involved in LPS biosynthesis
MPIVFGTPTRRVQLIHLRTDISAAREIESATSLQQLTVRGIDYVERINPRSTHIPASVRSFCRRPADIVDSNTPGYMKITPAAWGCYAAHRDALYALSSDHDYTLICECDAGLAVPLSEFCWIVEEAIQRMERDPVYFVNLTIHPSSIVEEEELPYDDLFTHSWYQILTTGYLVPNHRRDWFWARIRDSEWDSADMWYNHVFCHHREMRLRARKRYIGFFSGTSLIDNSIVAGTL